MKQLVLPIAFLIALLTVSATHAQDILTLKNGNEIKVKVQEITPQEIKYKRFDNINGPLITILKNTASSIKYENGTTENLNETTQQVPASSYVNPDANTSINYAQTGGFGIGDVVKTDYYGSTYQGRVTEINSRRGSAVVDLDKNGRSQKVIRQFKELTLVEKSKTVTVVPSSNFVANTPDNAPVQPVNQNYADLYNQGQTDAKRYYNGYHGAGTGTFLTTFLVGPILGLIPAIACSSTAPSQDRLGFPNNQLAQNNNYYTGYTQEAKRIKSRKVWGNFGIATGILFGIVIVASATAH